MNTDDDILLDRIASYLKMEAVPEMPVELSTARGTRRRLRVRYGVAAGALAASIVAVSLWGLRRSEEARPLEVAEQRRARAESAVMLQAVDLTAPFKRIEAGFTAIDDEIRELQSKAALLDARKKADELLARF